MKNEKNDILWRVYLLYFIVLLAAAAIVYRLVFIQVVEGSELKQLAKKQEIKEFTLEAARGSILSDQGELLATSIPVFDIRMDVANPNISDEYFYAKVDSLSLDLSKLFGKSKKFIKRQLIKARKTGNRYQLIARNVDYNGLKKLRTFPIFRKGRYRGGLIAVRKTKRKLPFGNLAARTIGYINKTQDIYVGIEGAYSDMLSGKNGKQLRRRINHGDWVPIFNNNDVEPRDGFDVVTTININIQDVVEEALMRQMINHKASIGCAIVMEVKTGDIKAIANLKYDSKDGKYSESYNMAIGDRFEPGSTFKLPSLMAALEDRKIKLTDTVGVGKGYVIYYHRILRDAHIISNGTISVREAFEHSSNVGVSKLIWRSYKKNPTQFVNHLVAMSLDKPTGIEISGEPKPRIKKPGQKDWYGTTLPWMSVGYEVQLTPLQILTFYNAVANDGIMMKPRIVSAIKDGGIIIKKIDTTVLNPHIASEATIKIAQDLLRDVVLYGTGKKLRNKHFAIAGKTGTAKIARKGGYIKGAYNATFVGYFPAGNPQYSCIVVISKPKINGYYGAAVASPAFKEIADKMYATLLALKQKKSNNVLTPVVPVQNKAEWYADVKNIYRAFGVKVNDYLKDEQWVKVKKQGNKTVALTAVDFNTKHIPNVHGMKAKDAVYLLENMGVTTKIKGRGVVRSQSLKPGTPVNGKQNILLRLSIL